MTKTVFKTPRTTVRRWQQSDLSALLKVYGDKDAMRWVGDGEVLSESEAKRWLTVTENNYEKRGYGMFAVEMGASSELIGFCGIVHPDNQAEPEMKYAYSRAYWGQGIATEVARGIIEYGAACHGLTHIIATTAPENTASHRVLLKAGMERGIRRKETDGSLTQLFEWRA